MTDPTQIPKLPVTDPTTDTEKASSSSGTTAASHHTPEEPPEEQHATDIPDGGARAWMVAGGVAGIQFCTMGYTNSFGVFQAYYASHQLRHDTPDRIAWIGSLLSFLVFAAGAVSGPLFDRYGARVIYPAAAAYLFAVMMTSLCTAYWQFVLAQGLLSGAAAGMLVFPALAAMPQYFDKRRAGAMGIAIAGSSLGGVVFPIALGKMLNDSDIGFGWSVRICGFVMAPILLFSCLAIKERVPPRKSSFFLPSAFKNGLYAVLLVAIFCQLIGMFVPLIFLSSYAIRQGMKPTLASYLVAMFNGASIFGRVLPGLAADRLGRLNIFALMGACTGVLIFVWPKVVGEAGIIVFTVVLGFTSGAIVSGASVALTLCPPTLKEMGTYLGQGLALSSLAALVGPPVTGVMVNKFGGYTQVSYFGGVFALVGAALVIVAKTWTKQGILGKI